MRLGIFGGSFDPVHWGHLLLAECCREQCRLDAVWFLPAAVPPHKTDRQLAPVENRVEMLELAVAGQENFSVCRYEADRGGVNYTADTLQHLKSEDPTRELFFLLGADMLNDLPYWRYPVRVCELAIPVAVQRPGVDPLNLSLLRPIAVPDRIDQIERHIVNMPAMGISSSEIRLRAAIGKSIRFLTPRPVEEYIKSHGLYLPAKPE